MGWLDSYVVEPGTYKRDRIPVDRVDDDELDRRQMRFSNLTGAGLLCFTVGFTFLATYEADWVAPVFWALCVAGTGCLIGAHRTNICAPWQ
jgi:uncharacterized membrane protein (DUF485 family)